MEVVDDLLGVQPRPVHPEIPDWVALQNFDKPRRMVVVGARQDHVVDGGAIVPGIYVLDDGVGGIGIGSVGQMHCVAGKRVPIADKNSAAAALATDS